MEGPHNGLGPVQRGEVAGQRGPGPQRVELRFGRPHSGYGELDVPSLISQLGLELCDAGRDLHRTTITKRNKDKCVSPPRSMSGEGRGEVRRLG